MTDAAQHERIARECRLHARTLEMIGAPMYAALAGRMAEDPPMIALMANTPHHQLQDIALFTAVNYLLLQGRPSPLADLHPVMTARPADAAALYPLLREFALEHADDIGRLLQTRPVQYTLPGRASFVFPALYHVAGLAGEPLSIIEIGCSVGFNLLFDRYHYDYGAAGTAGDPDSPVRLQSEFRGEPAVVAARMPRRIPAVARRAGIDINVIDVGDEDQYRWLLANLWPEQLGRRRNFEAAIGILRRNPLRVEAGDALEVLPRLIDEFDGPLCVFHSAVLYYWTPAQIAALDALLADTGRRRPVHRFGIEQWSMLGTEGRDRSIQDGSVHIWELIHHRYEGGGSVETRLGRCDGHGGRIRWL
ncbi:MAG: DUF2332 domain-containing protein [Gammaproteobacteria bacterium]